MLIVINYVFVNTAPLIKILTVGTVATVLQFVHSTAFSALQFPPAVLPIDLIIINSMVLPSKQGVFSMKRGSNFPGWIFNLRLEKIISCTNDV